MLSFSVYQQGKPAEQLNLAGAYVVGTDDVPLRADISFKNGVIQCVKRAAGPAGLAIVWNVPGAGRLLVETIRVPERDKPYVLQVELARGRLLRVQNKLEEWGLSDFDGAADLNRLVDQARDTLIKALQADQPAAAAELGDKALGQAAQASEKIAALHADLFLSRRKQAGALGKRVFGCAVSAEPPEGPVRKSLACFDFVTVPTAWRDIEPAEQSFNWKPLDAAVEALAKDKMPLRGSPLLSFHERNVPDWLYIWEHDFDTIRDLAFEHVRRVVQRFGQHVQSWVIASGLHAANCFSFNFEQLLEMTRMSASLTRQLSPRGVNILELVMPWGEYYARNQRTIPPLLYADMAVQGGVNFDAFGLQVRFGPAMDGLFVRDMFQFSSMLDQFSKLGKPVHITGIQAPSSTAPVRSGDPDVADAAADGGVWRKPWDEPTQAAWLRAVAEIALSKPFVESVSWMNLVDEPSQVVPHGGLLRPDHAPKAALTELTTIRTQLFGKSGR